MGKELEVTFIYRRASFVSTAAEIARLTPRTPRQKGAIGAGLAVGLGGAIGIALCLVETFGNGWTAFALFVLSSLAVGAAIGMALRRFLVWIWWKRGEVGKVFDQSDEWKAEQVWSIRSDGLLKRNSARTTNIAWSHLREILETDSSFVLLSSSRAGQGFEGYLPKYVFSAPEDESDFRSALAEHVPIVSRPSPSNQSPS